MRRPALPFLLPLLVACAAGEADSPVDAGSTLDAGTTHPVVVLTTSLGEVRVELYPERAPITVANFLEYVDAQHYDGTVFHRVIADFMIQGGGLTSDLKPKTTRAPIVNEAANGLSNMTGTIAMARTSVPDSATSQFFINTKDNLFLDFKNTSAEGIGYCVFGAVVAGMEVVRAIEATPTGRRSGMNDVPLTAVVIESARRLDDN